MFNYYECRGESRTAGKKTLANGGHGDLTLCIRSDQDVATTVLLCYVTHIASYVVWGRAVSMRGEDGPTVPHAGRAGITAIRGG